MFQQKCSHCRSHQQVMSAQDLHAPQASSELPDNPSSSIVCCSHCSTSTAMSHGVLQSKKATITLIWSLAVHIFYIFSLVSPQVMKACTDSIRAAAKTQISPILKMIGSFPGADVACQYSKLDISACA